MVQCQGLSCQKSHSAAYNNLDLLSLTTKILQLLASIRTLTWVNFNPFLTINGMSSGCRAQQKLALVHHESDRSKHAGTGLSITTDRSHLHCFALFPLPLMLSTSTNPSILNDWSSTVLGVKNSKDSQPPAIYFSILQETLVECCKFQ